ncbi:MAG: iron-containing alcohol dehydrogenase, partial [Pirellulales bacterium]
MKTVLIAPRKYIQGRGVLDELGNYVNMLGSRPLILWGPHVKEIVSDSVQKSMDAAGLEMVDVVFQGEATTAERARVTQVAR